MAATPCAIHLVVQTVSRSCPQGHGVHGWLLEHGVESAINRKPAGTSWGTDAPPDVLAEADDIRKSLP